MIKFLCEHCNNIVATDFDDPMVLCGHCEQPTSVPQAMGPRVVIDDFTLLRLAGQGGMGDVYIAHQHSLDRIVALKILKEEFSSNKKFMDEFIREARSVASLNHQNIIQAYKVGIENGLFFFAMEYVEGKTLAQFMKEQGVLDQELAIDVAIEITRALGYAWDQCRMVHRDIKPENIMVTEDGVSKLMDMGLSRKAEDTADDSDTISGTPQYISPEQIVGSEMDIRGDFYSLGATLYHLMTGRYVFDGNLNDMIHKHVSEIPVPPKKINPEIHEEVSKIIIKLLGKLPADRYQTAKELERDLLKAQIAIKTPDVAGKKKKVFKLNASPDAGAATGKHAAAKIDKTKTGKSAAISDTDRRAAVKTGKHPKLSSNPNSTGKSYANTNTDNTAYRKGVAVTPNTTSANKRSKNNEKNSPKEKKKDNTALIIGGAAAIIILIIIIVVLVMGKKDGKDQNQNTATTTTQTPPNTNNKTTDKPKETTPNTPVANPYLSNPDLLKALKVRPKFPGINYKYYEAKITKLDELAPLKPKLTGNYHMISLDFKKRATDFAIVYEGYITLPETTEYTFYSASDDGSRIYIDDKLVVDNDGIRALIEKNGKVIAEKGVHKIKIEYFQTAAAFVLDVKLEYPKFEKTSIPRGWLGRD